MIDDLLNRLERVRKTGPGRWVARCPTRDDRNPSMTIRLLDDGRVLLHDFGGSSVREILDALGLDWSALFPEDTKHQARPTRRPFPALDVLRAVLFEMYVVLAVAGRVRGGVPLTPLDYQRLATACGRLQLAVDIAEGGRDG